MLPSLCHAVYFTVIVAVSQLCHAVFFIMIVVSELPSPHVMLCILLQL